MKRLSHLIILALLALCGKVFCGEPTVELDKIVVTPSRVEESGGETPYKVDLLNGTEIRESYPADLAESLETLTSVNVNDYGGPGQSKTLRIRGASASQVLVMVDGRPVNSPRDGQTDLSSIPLSFIDRVEVVHGPGSSLYGSSAMGGMINILTKDPPRNPQTQIISLAGNQGALIERFSNGATAGKFGYIFNGEYRHSDGFRDNSVSDNRSASAKLTYETSENGKLSLNTGFSDDRTGTPGPKSSPDNDDRQLDRKNFVDAGWEFDAGEGLSFSARAYRNYEKLRFYENSAGSMFDTAGAYFRHATTTNGYELQATREFGDAYTLTGGASYSGNFNDSTSSGSHSYNVRAAYLENIVNITDKARVNFGARLDDYSNFGTKVNPNAGVVYSFNDTDKLRAAISSSFRAPTFNDLYWPDEGWAKGNPSVQPEESVNIEAGVDKKVTEKLTSSVTVFRNRFSNLIEWAENAGVWMPTNIGSAEIEGVEFANTLRLTERVSVGLDYTWQRPKDRTTKKDLIYQPRHKADARLTYKDKGLRCNLNAEYVGGRFHDSANTIKMKQFFLLDFSLDKRINPHVDLLLNINNLLNKKYEAVRDYPAPGTAVLTGIKVSF